MVFRIPVGRERDRTSLYHSSLLEFVFRFDRQKPLAHISFHDLDVKIGTPVVDVVESTDVFESGQTLNLLETQEVHLVSRGTCA